MKLIAMFKRIATAWYMFVEGLKGEKTFVEVSNLRKTLNQVTMASMHGFEIRIQTVKRYYHHRYQQTWFDSRKHVIFHVTSYATRDAPAYVKDACISLTVLVPELAPSYVYDEKQHEIVIQAYLDLLTERLSMHQARQTYARKEPP